MVVMTLLAVVVTSLDDVVASVLQWRSEAKGFSRAMSDSVPEAYSSAGTQEPHARAGSS